MGFVVHTRRVSVLACPEVLVSDETKTEAFFPINFTAYYPAASPSRQSSYRESPAAPSIFTWG